MTTKIKLIICMLVLCIFNIRGLSAQDLSTIYIDAESGTDEYQPRDQPTMDGIETALGKYQQDPEHVLGRLSNYVSPILNEQKTSDALMKITEEFSLEYENIFAKGNEGRLDFLALTPLLDAIERNEDSEVFKVLRDTWTNDLRGFALSSLVSAIRFGACVELGMKLIDNEESDEPEMFCERPDYGKINDWHYNETTGTGSFHLDDMKVNLYSLSLNASSKIEYELVKQWSYNWQVSIELPGYFKAERMDIDDYNSARVSNPDVDPFVWTDGVPTSTGALVNLPTLPAAAKKIPDGAIWPDQRDLNHRLFANGLSVNVVKVEGTLYKMRPAVTGDVNIHNDPITQNEFVRDGIEKGPVTLAPDHPYLTPSTESCVDIMLNIKDAFPVTINDHPFSTDQKGWCLGRCTKPVIQNSR